MFPQRPIWPTLVSLRNRTTGRSGRQNTCVWQTWHCYFLRVLSWSSLNDNVFWSLPKDPFKGKWCLAKRNFKQNYCHAWHTKIKVFVPLPSCCVSSLLTRCSSIQQAISEFQNPHYSHCIHNLPVTLEGLTQLNSVLPGLRAAAHNALRPSLQIARF